MSTYLLAMVVARLDFVEGYSAKGVKYRVYTMPAVTEQGRFALDVGRDLFFISISVGSYFFFCLVHLFIYLLYTRFHVEMFFFAT
jgi:hypothetical protein